MKIGVITLGILACCLILVDSAVAPGGAPATKTVVVGATVPTIDITSATGVSGWSLASGTTNTGKNSVVTVTTNSLSWHITASGGNNNDGKMLYSDSTHELISPLYVAGMDLSTTPTVISGTAAETSKAYTLPLSQYVDPLDRTGTYSITITYNAYI